jgi:superfamily II DNA/RNA helicase
MELRKITDYQAKYFAHELQRSYANDHVGKLAGLLFDAQVEPKPHQIDAALFALQTPFLKGVILADEVGLGKTIEAGIVISQFWAERKRKILIITPSSLRQQWQQELIEKFHIPSTIVDMSAIRSHKKTHGIGLIGRSGVYICSYDFANRNSATLSSGWDLVVADEAHKLRNHWTGKGKVAESVSEIMKWSNKVLLLTATPLQNKLEELYGLVSVFDPKYFHSIDAFKERYVKNPDDTVYNDLAGRVSQITKRTLRKDAEKYIKFTKRLPLTLEFESAPEEQKLYDLVNNYLQREQLYAFAPAQRHLSVMIIRKRLGSSTYAVSSTLENIAKRLQDELDSGQRRDNRGGLFVDDELTDDEEEEFDNTDTANKEDVKSSQAEEIKAEIAELRQYASLARSIKVNQKAVKLLDALDQGFAKLVEIGAPEKAIIFTDSTKTQEYIANSLKESGRGDGLVLFNGSNDSSESTAIYKNWLEKNKGSDLITGIASADRRKALVDHFRNEGNIMIATEAAAEGINLQFCSMLVNYDLPWNPQRVEQRIGRIHRFGQKFNVIVVNFSNKNNVAEQRILELLTNKFKLFESVFGASDQVLGSIEDGFDLEKQISSILNRCKSADEINVAFDILAEQFATEITQEMEHAKTKVFDNLDPNVQDRLKHYDKESGEVLNKFERLLMSVTQHQLKNVADFYDDGKTFVLHSSPIKDAPAGKYYFKSKPIEHARQYRYSDILAQYVIGEADNLTTPQKHLVFSLGRSDRVPTVVRELADKKGIMVVKKLTFGMKAKTQDVSESYTLAAALTSDGKYLDSEHVQDILELSCVKEDSPLAIDENIFDGYLTRQTKELEKEVRTRNTKYFDQQEEMIYRKSLDQKAESAAKIRDYQKKEKEARHRAKMETDPLKQLELKKEARKWETRVEEEEDRAREERSKNREVANEWLEQIENALKGNQRIEDLFAISWEIVK